jgi:hypothetical protein
MTYIKCISVKDISKILKNILISIRNLSIRILRNIQISIKNFSIRILISIRIYYCKEFVCNTAGVHKLLLLGYILFRVISTYYTLDNTFILEYFYLILENFNLIYLEDQLFTDSTFLNMDPTGEGPSNNTLLGGNDSVGEGSSNNTPWGKGPTGSGFYEDGEPNLLLDTKGRDAIPLSDYEYASKLQESRSLKESMMSHNFVAEIKKTTGGKDFYYSFKDRHGSRLINFWPEIFHKNKASITEFGAMRTYQEDGVTFTYNCRSISRGEFYCTVSYEGFNKVITDKIELMRHLARHQEIYGKLKQ